MLVSFLFWNLLRKPLQQRLARLALAHEIDVFVLAECNIDPSEMLEALNGATGGSYNFPRSQSVAIQIFMRLPAPSIVETYNSANSRLTIRELKVGDRPGILLAGLHFQDKRNWSPGAQGLEATVVANAIARSEDRVGHRRTVLVGDLNMNPFELGVVGAQAFNAVMTRDLARRQERTVAGCQYPFFYNPMWGFFGDRTPGPPGTYFHAQTDPTGHYWHIIDQVLLRPELMDKLVQLQILDTDGNEPLVSKRGRPDCSDHLPLLFTLDL